RRAKRVRWGLSAEASPFRILPQGESSQARASGQIASTEFCETDPPPDRASAVVLPPKGGGKKERGSPSSLGELDHVGHFENVLGVTVAGDRDHRERDLLQGAEAGRIERLADRIDPGQGLV